MYIEYSSKHKYIIFTMALYNYKKTQSLGLFHYFGIIIIYKFSLFLMNICSVFKYFPFFNQLQLYCHRQFVFYQYCIYYFYFIEINFKVLTCYGRYFCFYFVDFTRYFFGSSSFDYMSYLHLIVILNKQPTIDSMKNYMIRFEANL